MKKYLCLMLIAVSCFSCSKSDFEPAGGSKTNEEQKGRFDNKPVVWDKVYSTYTPSEDEINLLYTPGNKSTAYNENFGLPVMDATELYVGGVYPISRIKKEFFDEQLIEPRNPIRLMFKFGSLSHLVRWAEEIDKLGYAVHQEDALMSDKYKQYLESNSNNKSSFKMTEVYSYSDVEKALGGGFGFADFFFDKKQASKKDTKQSSKALIITEVRNYTVSMASPGVDGLFMDAQLNNSQDHVYINKIEYGKFAYALIESPYSYADLSYALLSGYGCRFNEADLDAKSIEVLNSSKIAIYTVADNFSGNYFVNNLTPLSHIFESNFAQSSAGIPLTVVLRTVSDNFTLTKEKLLDVESN